MTTNLRKGLFFALLVSITYIGYRYMIKPANNALVEKRKNLDDKLLKLSKFEGHDQSAITAENLNNQLNQLREAIKSLEDKLPPTNEIDKVLQSITVIVQKQGLKPKTIRTLKQKHDSGYVEQPLKMELSGDFNSFYSFLLELERLDRIMKIRNLELKKQFKKEGEIAANFVISIFFQT
jgi:Tfp pilus assembly protein PilO